MIWLERKASAFMQDRTGPNRAAIAGVRLGGVIHTLADVAKLLGKEDVVPSQVNRGYYAFAPFIAISEHATSPNVASSSNGSRRSRHSRGTSGGGGSEAGWMGALIG